MQKNRFKNTGSVQLCKINISIDTLATLPVLYIYLPRSRQPVAPAHDDVMPQAGGRGLAPRLRQGGEPGLVDPAGPDGLHEVGGVGEHPVGQAADDQHGLYFWGGQQEKFS